MLFFYFTKKKAVSFDNDNLHQGLQGHIYNPTNYAVEARLPLQADSLLHIQATTTLNSYLRPYLKKIKLKSKKTITNTGKDIKEASIHVCYR